MSTNPKILNLDDLESTESDVTIKHEGVDHVMRVLDVDQFIAQQKRAIQQQKMAEEAEAVGDKDMVAVLTLIRDSIQEFFPTLPVGQLPTPKLFIVFAWLNEMAETVNQIGSPDEGEGIASAEGKVEAVQS